MPMRCIENACEKRYKRDSDGPPMEVVHYTARFEVANSETTGITVPGGLKIASEKPLAFIAGREYLLRLQMER